MPDRRKVSRAAIAHSGEPPHLTAFGATPAPSLPRADALRQKVERYVMAIAGAEDAPAPKASGWLSAKRELRSSRKGLRVASEAVAKLIVEN